MRWLLLLGLLVAGQAWADLFILPTGAGAQNGTDLANACNTLSDVDCNANAAAGQTVYVCDPGTGYSRSSSWSVTNANPNVIWNGDCSAFGAYSSRAKITNTAGSYNLQWGGSGSAIFWNIELAGGSTADCVNIAGSGSVIVKGMYIHDCVADGIDHDNTSASLIVTESTIERAAAYGLFAGNIGTPGAVRVFGNTFTDNGTTASSNNDAIGIGDGVPSSLVADNVITGQKSLVGAGIDLQDSTGAATVVHRAYRNLVMNCEAGPGLSSTGSASTEFVGNVVIDCFYGALPKGGDATATQKYINNTFANSRDRGIKIATTETGAATNITLTNNAIVNSGAFAIANDVDGSTFTSDYSGVSDGATFKDANTGSGCTGSCTLTEWQAAGNDANGISATSPLAGGNHVQTADDACLPAGSAFRAAGTYIGAWATGYAGQDLGNPPAIGARRSCDARRAVATRRTLSDRRAP